MLIDDDLESCRRVISPAFVDENGAVVGFPIHERGHYAFWREYIPAEAVVWDVVEGGVFSVCLVMPRELWAIVDTLQEFFPDVHIDLLVPPLPSPTPTLPVIRLDLIIPTIPTP